MMQQNVEGNNNTVVNGNYTANHYYHFENNNTQHTTTQPQAHAINSKLIYEKFDFKSFIIYPIILVFNIFFISTASQSSYYLIAVVFLFTLIIPFVQKGILTFNYHTTYIYNDKLIFRGKTYPFLSIEEVYKVNDKPHILKLYHPQKPSPSTIDFIDSDTALLFIREYKKFKGYSS